MESPTPTDRMRVITGNGKSNGLPIVIWAAIAGVVLLALAGGAVLVAMGKVSFIQLPAASKPAAQTKVLTPAEQLTAAQKELQQATTPAQKAVAYEHIGDAYNLLPNQSTQAVEAFQSALAQNSSNQITVLSSMMVSYGQAGDTANEIATIKKIIPLLQQSKSTADQHLAIRYQSFLSNLEAQQQAKQ